MNRLIGLSFQNEHVVHSPSTVVSLPSRRVLRRVWCLAKRSPQIMKGAQGGKTQAGWDLSCRHYEKCSGCDLQTDLQKPPLAATAEEFFTGLGVEEFRTLGVTQHAWRCRAKLAIRGSPGKPVVGLFKKGSHHAMPIPNCRVHHPRINSAVDVLHRLLAALRTTPYNEVTSAGALRYVQLTLAAQSPHDKAHKDWAPTVQDGKSNTIFSQHWQLLHGEEMAWQCFGSCPIALGPGGFVQANYGAMDLALEHIKAATPIGSCVTEMHAGVGVIGLNIAQDRQPTKVTFVEINPACQSAFEASKAFVKKGAELHYHVAAAGSSPRTWLEGADVLIVDPPRKGLEPSLLEALKDPAAHKLHTLIYLSCDFKALQHDCKALLDSAAWQVSGAKAFLFFPGTNSLETLAVFKRRTMLDSMVVQPCSSLA